MKAECKLSVVGWLYVLVGTHALIGQLVSLFVPVEHPGFEAHFLIPGLNLAVLVLPAGVGLLRRHAWWHAAALTMNWLALALLGATLVLLAAGAVLGENKWEPNESMSGDDYMDLLVGVVIVLPLLVWQFRTLRSSEVRRVIESAKRGPPKVGVAEGAES